MFGQWVNATIDGNEDQVRFYESRFRDELIPAFDDWWPTDPVNNPDAPPGPFIQLTVIPTYEAPFHAAPLWRADDHRPRRILYQAG
jgi:hypothetical protein